MRVISKLIHKVQRSTLWRNTLACIAIGFIVTFLATCQSNLPIESSSPSSNYPNSSGNAQGGDQIVLITNFDPSDLSQPTCANALYKALNRIMTPENISAQWKQDHTTYVFDWPNNRSKGSERSKDLIAFVSYSSATISHNPVKLAQNYKDCSNLVNGIQNVQNDHRVTVTSLNARGKDLNGRRCCCEQTSDSAYKAC